MITLKSEPKSDDRKNIDDDDDDDMVQIHEQPSI